jgi:hypothetical protein
MLYDWCRGNSVKPNDRIPDDPLKFIQECVRHRRILWTYHVNMRLEGRHIAQPEILQNVETFEVIEQYPEDKYLPSYLILAGQKEAAFHVLFATDTEGANVRIVTAYRPDPEQWMPDLRTRRKK